MTWIAFLKIWETYMASISLNTVQLMCTRYSIPDIQETMLQLSIWQVICVDALIPGDLLTSWLSRCQLA